MVQADDCAVYGYTWVEKPDESVRVVRQFDPRERGCDYPIQYKVVPKEPDKGG